MEKLKIKPFNPVEGMPQMKRSLKISQIVYWTERKRRLAPLNSYASNAT